MAVKEVKIYICSDGGKFEERWVAEKHEQQLNDIEFAKMHGIVFMKSANWLRTSYNGQRLREKHSLDEEGIWRIRGEDPNCDMGGHHHQPELGTVEGKLRDIVEYAVNLDGFYTWGSGGNITKVSIRKV